MPSYDATVTLRWTRTVRVRGVHVEEGKDPEDAVIDAAVAEYGSDAGIIHLSDHEVETMTELSRRQTKARGYEEAEDLYRGDR